MPLAVRCVDDGKDKDTCQFAIKAHSERPRPTLRKASGRARRRQFLHGLGAPTSVGLCELHRTFLKIDDAGVFQANRESLLRAILGSFEHAHHRMRGAEILNADEMLGSERRSQCCQIIYQRIIELGIRISPAANRNEGELDFQADELVCWPM